MGIFDAIAEEQEAEEREAREFRHEKYRSRFLRLVETRPKKFIGDVYQEDPDNPGSCRVDSSGVPVKPVIYGEDQELICCPEPIEFISEFNDWADDQDTCKKIMRELIAGQRANQSTVFQRIRLDLSLIHI